MSKLHQPIESHKLTKSESQEHRQDSKKTVNICCPLHHAIQKGDLDKTQSLIDDGVDPNAKCLGLGFTALQMAAMIGNLNAVKLLIDAGANLDTTDKMKQWTALHYAAVAGYSEIAKLLILSGANFNIRDNSKKTASNLAFAQNHIDTVNIIQLTIQYIALTKKDIIKICEDTQILGRKLPSVASHLEESKLLVLNMDCLEIILSHINNNNDLQSLKKACTIELYKNLLNHNTNMQAIGESGEELYDNAQ
ncbi:ankyrin repeat family protein [Orientia chuto str. Dubai]|uniref:Ankyrin repeat family protein n=1 Tax=Orientia chuto str. Dubai TaxID=1359168 RepID=A0A0F3MFQ1_9RICK|nr:ankyrin repeat domain-containing protein [Candidatus Orientia mediorientalis]KJV54578.1 ankyrin repeat family protein [Orientia chuto str. Dubai]